MQVFRQMDPEAAALVGWGVRVMLLAPDYGDRLGKVATRIAGLGGIVDTDSDIFAALDTAMSDPTGYGLFVVECDAFGGIAAAQNIVAMLRRGGVQIPVILVSSDCAEQTFPIDGHDPILLRAPLSAVALRVGFEHALRHRLIYSAA